MGQGSQVVQAEGHLRMRRAEGLCAYGQGALRERLRGHTPLRRIEWPWLLRVRSHLWVHGAEDVLPDRQGPVVQGLRLSIVAQGMRGPRQVVEGEGHRQVSGPKTRSRIARARWYRAAARMLALRLIEAREVVEGRRHVGVRRTQGLLQQRQGTLEQRCGLGIVVLHGKERREMVRMVATSGWSGPRSSPES